MEREEEMANACDLEYPRLEYLSSPPPVVDPASER
jgi:hypothetical protein